MLNFHRPTGFGIDPFEVSRLQNAIENTILSFLIPLYQITALIVIPLKFKKTIFHNTI